LGVPQIERCFRQLKIETPDDFYAHVCDCVVCKGVVLENLSQFSSFGDQHYSTPVSKRLAQTPAAAKRCRFHFLLARIKEKALVNAESLTGLLAKLKIDSVAWSAQYVLEKESLNIDRWITVLTPPRQ
jgi:hypothetical protein